MAALNLNANRPKVSLNDTTNINIEQVISDNADKVVEIPLDELVGFKYKGAVQPFAVRDSEVAILVESISTYGQLTPCAVREYKGKYQIISGHKRLKAAKKLGLEHLKCIIIECDDQTAFELVKHYNIQRDKPKPSEIMELVKQTKAKNKTADGEEELTVTEIANLFGVGRKHIYRCYSLRKLPKKIHSAVDEEIIGTNDIEKIVNNIPAEHLDGFAEWVEYQDKKVSSSTLKKIYEYSEICLNNPEKDFDVDAINQFIENYSSMKENADSEAADEEPDPYNSTDGINFFSVIRMKYPNLSALPDSEISSLIDNLLVEHFNA